MNAIKTVVFKRTMICLQSMIFLCIVAFPLAKSGSEDEGREGAVPKSFDPDRDFYAEDVLDIKGNHFSLKRFRGKVALVVNVASECGYTENHYRDLTKIYKELETTEKFTVLAFPCNQFGGQEPGTNAEIEQYVRRKYKVTFPLFDKINVVGENVPEAWKLLIGEAGQAPTWNFWKYLVNGDGHVVNAWGPWIEVSDIRHEILDAVEELISPDLPYAPHHDHEEL